MENSRAGLIVLIAKLAPKLMPLLIKLGDGLWAVIKSLFGVKAAGLVGSVGLYTYLFTWQMALALIVFLAIHEYGHLWAMKRCGLKTRGMYFVPGFGAVALTSQHFGSARNEAYIAIMGPIFGFIGFVLPLVLIYRQTGDAIWAAIAAFTAFINLINLFPINPLDGGRILKSLVYSKRQLVSVMIIVIVSLATAFLGALSGFFLLFLMAVVGLWEIAIVFGFQKKVVDFLQSTLRTVVGVGLFVSARIVVLIIVGDPSPEFGKEISTFGKWVWSIMFIMLLYLLVNDIRELTVEENKHFLRYPLEVLRRWGRGVKQVLRLREVDMQPIEGYARMGSAAKVGYSLGFLILVALHVITILALSTVPGAELAAELLD